MQRDALGRVIEQRPVRLETELAVFFRQRIVFRRVLGHEDDHFLTSDGAGEAVFAAIARPSSEGLTGTGSTMSSGTL